MVGSDFEGRDEDKSISSKVVEEVAKQEAVDRLELNPPLADVVALDALENLVADLISREQRQEIWTGFPYCRHILTVRGDCKMEITDES